MILSVGQFDPVGVVAEPFDYPGAGAVAAVRVEVAQHLLCGLSDGRCQVSLSRPESPVRGTGLNGLTGREREVLTLNATGLTDQEIAGHLTVSPPLGQWDDLGSLRDRGGLGLHRARRSRSARS
jgi:hypothetical protein